MSVLRYLSQSKGISSRGASDTPTLTLRVHNYGILFLPYPEPPSDDSDEMQPREDHVLAGELEVQLRDARRVKGIRVGLKTIMVADFGGNKKYEEDVVFERKVEIIGGNADGLWLPSGLQK